jgi:hypothetical protein
MEIYLIYVPSNQSSNSSSFKKIRMFSTSSVWFKHINHIKTNKRAFNVIWTLIRFGTHHMDSTRPLSNPQDHCLPCFRNVRHFHTRSMCWSLFQQAQKQFNLKHVWSFKFYFEPWGFMRSEYQWEFVLGVPQVVSLNPKHFHLFWIIGFTCVNSLALVVSWIYIFRPTLHWE